MQGITVLIVQQPRRPQGQQEQTMVSALNSIGVHQVSEWESLRCLDTTIQLLVNRLSLLLLWLQDSGRTQYLQQALTSAPQRWPLVPVPLATTVLQAASGHSTPLTTVPLAKIVLLEQLQSQRAFQEPISRTHCSQLATRVPKASTAMALKLLT